MIPSIVKDKKGVILLLTFIIMMALITITAAFLYMTSVQLKSSGYDLESSEAFWSAEGGVQYGSWAVKADRTAAAQTTDPEANGYCGTVSFDGYQYAGSGAIGDEGYEKACFYEDNPMRDGKNNDHYTELDAILGAYVTVWDFQQRVNMIGTRIKSARIGMRAQRGKGSGSDPIMQMQYTLNGGTAWTDVGENVTLEKNAWGVVFYGDFETDPTWQDIMDVDNFQIRALKMNSDSIADIDWLGLELTLECDTLTEPWSSGSYITLPYTVGNGTIQSITVTDESSKVHLNYAPQLLLERLMEELSISGAAGKAAAIVNYRNDDGWFNTIEEVQQVSNPVLLDSGDFDLLKDYITVYSWVNNQVTGTTGTRAPINVNTASELVLRAIFKTTEPSLGETIANRLARNIVKKRDREPFTHMNSSMDYDNHNRNTFSFYVDSKLSGVDDEDRENAVKENADASEYNSDFDQSWNGNDQTATEFCYYTNTFLITAVGQDGVIQRTIKTTYGENYDYTNFSPDSTGTFALWTYYPTESSPPSPHQYWREVRQ